LITNFDEIHRDIVFARWHRNDLDVAMEITQLSLEEDTLLFLSRTSDIRISKINNKLHYHIQRVEIVIKCIFVFLNLLIFFFVKR